MAAMVKLAELLTANFVCLDIAFATASGGDFFDPHRQIQDEAMGRKPVWSVDYYTRYFDVDTKQVSQGRVTKREMWR